MGIINDSAIESVAIDSLFEHPKNPRHGSVEAIAESISANGFYGALIVQKSTNQVLAGNHRLKALRHLGITEAPVIFVDVDDERALRILLADNRANDLASYNQEVLANILDQLSLTEAGLDGSLFDVQALEDVLESLAPETTEGNTDPDDVPEPPKEPITKPGDLWFLGDHRVMCGDSTAVKDVARLMDGKLANLLHADPPYGMGKASDGVINDNLYDEKLDNFQMEWWRTFRPFLEDNASAYIWGNAPELWRLWYKAGLGDSEQMELRNQIVWDKKAIPGMASSALTQFPVATEHCLFFQIGNQFRGNVNADDFPETWEPLRSYLEAEAKAARIGSNEIKAICGVQMYGHWFTRSQFTLIPEKHYAKLQANCVGRFVRPWSQLKAEWDKVKGGPTSQIQGARSYFDNAHDVMRDVWEFSRVTGDERHGHATPKPVEMMERVMKSSLPSGGLCVEPFGGSGSTLMGAEKTNRICYTMELDPRYCDVIVKRWEDFTGKKAVLSE